MWVHFRLVLRETLDHRRRLSMALNQRPRSLYGHIDMDGSLNKRILVEYGRYFICDVGWKI